MRRDKRWVKTAALMPWELVDEMYARRMSLEKGCDAILSRIAFGAEFIKEQENLTDGGTVIFLSENPYAQYFMGLKEFRTELLFYGGSCSEVRPDPSKQRRSPLNPAPNTRIPTPPPE